MADLAPWRGRVLMLAAVGWLGADPLRKLFPALASSGLLLVYIAALLVLVSSSGLGSLRLAKGGVGVVWLTIALGALLTASWAASPISAWNLVVSLSGYSLFLPMGLSIAALWSAASPRDRRAAERWVLRFGVVVAVSGVLSVLLDHRLLDALTDEAGRRSFGSGYLALAPGLFATGERLARSLLVPIFVLVFAARHSKIGHAHYPVLLVLYGWALLATNRRFAVMLAVIGILAIILASRRRRRYRRTQVVFATKLVLASALLVISVAFASAFYGSGSDQLRARIALAAEMPDDGTLFGVGPGTNTQGANTSLGGPGGGAFEGQIGRVSYEMGYVGLAVWALWAALVARLAYRRFLHSREALPAACAVLCLALLVWSVKAHTVFGDPFSVSVFWAALGLVMALPRSATGGGESVASSATQASR